MREDEGKTEEDTDTDEEGAADVDDDDGKGQQGFTNNGEPEFKPKKVKSAKKGKVAQKKGKKGVARKINARA